MCVYRQLSEDKTCGLGRRLRSKSLPTGRSTEAAAIIASYKMRLQTFQSGAAVLASRHYSMISVARAKILCEIFIPISRAVFRLSTIS